LNRVPGAGWALWNSIKGRDGTRPAFRVGQVDAELLDEELLGLMKNQVGDALKYFGVCRSPVQSIKCGCFLDANL
jgi:peroxin-2